MRSVARVLRSKVLIYSLLVFIFSVSIRLFWVYHFYGNEAFMFNGELMINTNDGYFYAEGARDIIAGFNQEFDLSPIGRALSQLTALIAYILPISIESTILYMPIFFGSLVAFPLVLIGHSLGRLDAGVIAALLASIAWSYYNRTMAGYYDTDMLNIVFPTLLVWSLVLSVKSNANRYLLFTALEIIAYRWWYPQSYSLEFAFFILMLIYTGYVYLKSKKELFSIEYLMKLLILMLFAMMFADILWRLVIVFALFALFLKPQFSRFLPYMFIVAAIAFFATGGFDPIWAQLKGYVFRDGVTAVGDSVQLHYFSVMQTVREAGKIPFEVFANRISGSSVTFMLSIIGYLFLIYRHPVMLLGLPMIGLGFLAYSSGLRFTIYAVPVLALGAGYMIVIAADFLKGVPRYIFIIVATAAALYPNISHIYEYRVPVVFNKDEVKMLDALGKKADREDYVLAWWDYGYPIRYYSDVKTLVDGGKHSGAVNFPISYALLKPQLASVNMARFAVEYTEKSYRESKRNIELEIKSEPISYIGMMMRDSSIFDSNDFLELLESDSLALPEKTRDIYYYLPYRMLNILSTVSLFSRIDLMSSKREKAPFFFQTSTVKNSGEDLLFGSKIRFNKKSATLYIGNQNIKIKSFITTEYSPKGELDIKHSRLHLNGKLHIIFMKNYRKILILDEELFNSAYIQLFVLEQYNRELFEPTTITPWAKIYRVKR